MAQIFVHPDGSNGTNVPGTAADPLRTLQFGIDRAGPGDVVVGMAAIHAPFTPKSNITVRGQGGTVEVIGGKSLRGPGGAIIDGSAVSGDLISVGQDVGLNNFILEGFELRNAEGALISLPRSSVTLRDLLLHDSIRSGVILREGDLHMLERLHIYGVAKQQPGSAANAISILRATNRPGTPPASWGGFRTILRDIVSHNNVPTAGPVTDGGGIAWDGAATDQVDYTGPWLIEGCIVYDNGGSGIRLIYGKDGVVRNNTVVSNCDDPRRTSTFGAGIQSYRCRHIHFESNIVVEDNPDLDVHAYQDNSAADLFGETRDSTFVKNIFRGPGTKHVRRTPQFNGNPGVVPSSDTNKIGVNPLFVGMAARNFALQAGSPAIGYGPGGAYPDAGAVQSVVAPPPPAPFKVVSAPVITVITQAKSGLTYIVDDGIYEGGTGDGPTLTKRAQLLQDGVWVDAGEASGIFPSVTVGTQFNVDEGATKGTDVLNNASVSLLLEPADAATEPTDPVVPPSDLEEVIDRLVAEETRNDGQDGAIANARSRLAALEAIVGNGDLVAARDALAAANSAAESVQELREAVAALSAKLPVLREDQVLRLGQVSILVAEGGS